MNRYKALQKFALGSGMVVVLGAAMFPNFMTSVLHGQFKMNCCAGDGAADEAVAPVSPGAGSVPKDLSEERVSIYAVPLVCPTAPQIGCGSHAKPLFHALEQQPAVAQAWLNRAGTRMALVWKADAKPADRVSALNAAIGGGELQARELGGTERTQAVKDFLSGKNWFGSRDLDRLSEEEARVMAARLLRRVQAKISLSDADAEALRGEFKNIFTRRLTGRSADDEPPAEAQITKALRRHLDEKDVKMLSETLPHNLRPLPGEE